MKNDNLELYKKHRPKKFKDVIGQTPALKSLSSMIEKGNTPHAIMLTGPSGCGKTTLARIIANKLECNKHDTKEINSANFRGIDTVREIQSQVGLAPIHGKCRVWIIDEVHKITNDAQNAILKLLEDTPSHVYFFLCTTEPQKLLKTIHTRCSEVAVKSLNDGDVKKLLSNVLAKEEKKLPKKVIEKIIDNSEGSPRKALVFLHQIIDIEDEDDMLETIQPPSLKVDSIAIARALLKLSCSGKWAEMVAVLKACDLKQAESIRRLVLAYTQSVMLSGNKGLADKGFVILNAFREHFYDCGSAG